MFFAIWPDEPATRALAELARRVAVDARGRATAADRLHLTLAFVGHVAASDIDALAAMGRTVASRIAAFTLALDRVGAFRDAGIAWIGAGVPPMELLELATELKVALGSAGFRIDARDFKAHVTLARRCERRPRFDETPSVSWRVDTMSLMSSQLSPGGAHYSEIAACPLAAR